MAAAAHSTPLGRSTETIQGVDIAPRVGSYLIQARSGPFDFSAVTSLENLPEHQSVFEIAFARLASLPQDVPEEVFLWLCLVFPIQAIVG